MALSEYCAQRIPKSAQRVIASALSEIVPTNDRGPEHARAIRQRVEEVILEVVFEADTGLSGVVTHNLLSGKLREAVERYEDPEVGDVLNGIAQSIAILTGQKDGARCEPKALKPRGEEIESNASHYRTLKPDS